MTENKRFTHKDKSLYIDNDYFCELEDGNEITELLNRQQYTVKIISKENERLKQENKQLKQWNKCLAKKRHQELSYGYYTDSKAEKRVKDLFEHKPLNCSDRIKSDRYD